MSEPEVFEEDDDRRIVRAEDGMAIELRIEDDQVLVFTVEQPVRKVGYLSFLHIEYEPPLPDVYKLTHAFLDQAGPEYLRKGFGSAAVRFFSEYCDTSSIVSRDIGSPRADGSHPTGGGGAFTESLVRKGLATYDDSSDIDS